MTCNIPGCPEPKLPGRGKCRIHWNEYVREWYRHAPKARAAKRRGTLAKHGLTLEDYDAMLEAQDGVCAICGEAEEGKELAVDHCHRTERVRSLLCHACNNMLGCAKDDPTRLREGADYLDKHASPLL